MILALMPLGVEHAQLPNSVATLNDVILALMPLGVEHPQDAHTHSAQCE